MKKLLGIILAFAAMFSGTVFALPAAQDTENADEKDFVIYDGETQDAGLLEDVIDTDAPLYGVKLVSEDFESWTENDKFGYNTTTTGIVNKNGLKWKDENGHIWANTVTDTSSINGTGKAIKITASGYGAYESVRYEFTPVNIPAKYTVFADIRVDEEEFFNNLSYSIKPYARFKIGTDEWSYTSDNFSWNSSDAVAGDWFTHKAQITLPKTFTVDGVKTPSSNFFCMQYIFDQKTPRISGTIYMDNVKIYYKPTAAGEYTGVKFEYPTITLTTDGGFEESAAAAISANPDYISEAVKSVKFENNSMIITLDENKSAIFESIKIPELVNAAKDATYPEKEISLPDYYAPIYGIKNYYYNAASGSVENLSLNVDGYGGKYEFLSDDDGTAYIHLETKASWPGSLRIERNTSLPYGTGYTYTYFQKLRPFNADNKILLRGNSDGSGYNSINPTSPKNFVLGEWNEAVYKDYTIDPDTYPSDNKPYSNAPYIYLGNDGKSEKAAVDISYAGLYYKPEKTADAPVITYENGAVKLEYGENIDGAAATALPIYFKKYFGEDVVSLEVTDDRTVTLVLNDGVESVTMPALVNANKDAVYPETLVEAQAADLSPVTLDEKDIRLTSENSGLRFKAYVLHENLESLDEYGYIVALEKTLTDNGKALTDLTFELDKSTVKYVSEAAYIKGREVNYIFDKNYSVGDDTANLFTGVLTGIPKGKYDLNLVARPYAKSGTTYYYGEPISGNVQAVAKAVQGSEDYNNLSAEKKAIIDAFAENKAE